MEMKLNEQGLMPAIAQDCNTGRVLMLGYMSPDALQRTLQGDHVWYYSRSRDKLWEKGEVSGNHFNWKEVWVDCDGDTILLKVDPEGPACHTGKESCFFTPVSDMPDGFQTYADVGQGDLDKLFSVIEERKRDMPNGSYTADLISQGVGRIAQKVVEEAGETAIAAAQGNIEQLPGEVADLMYHALVLLAASGVTTKQVWAELRERRR